MRKTFAIIWTIGSLAAPCFAHAEQHRLSPMTAGNFLKICNDNRGRGLCDAYLAGVADGGALTYLSSVHDTGSGEAAFCIPAAEKTGRMRSEVVQWLRSHRAVYGGPVSKAVVAALHDAYPCRDSHSGAAQ